ncbi:MAG: hypothetical protein VYC40_02925, partial [Pseudomonadota bacterium]|nr:hypothetical protein [Pseudomonadota bacterium]
MGKVVVAFDFDGCMDLLQFARDWDSEGLSITDKQFKEELLKKTMLGMMNQDVDLDSTKFKNKLNRVIDDGYPASLHDNFEKKVNYLVAKGLRDFPAIREFRNILKAARDNGDEVIVRCASNRQSVEIDESCDNPDTFLPNANECFKAMFPDNQELAGVQVTYNDDRLEDTVKTFIPDPEKLTNEQKLDKALEHLRTGEETGVMEGANILVEFLDNNKNMLEEGGVYVQGLVEKIKISIEKNINRCRLNKDWKNSRLDEGIINIKGRVREKMPELLTQEAVVAETVPVAQENTKFATLIDQMHAAEAANLQSNESMTYTFMDDRKDILERANKFFSENPYLIPKGVELKMIHTPTSESTEKQSYQSIRGTGVKLKNNQRTELVRFIMTEITKDKNYNKYWRGTWPQDDKQVAPLIEKIENKFNAITERKESTIALDKLEYGDK